MARRLTPTRAVAAREKAKPKPARASSLATVTAMGNRGTAAVLRAQAATLARVKGKGKGKAEDEEKVALVPLCDVNGIVTYVEEHQGKHVPGWPGYRGKLGTCFSPNYATPGNRGFMEMVWKTFPSVGEAPTGATKGDWYVALSRPVDSNGDYDVVHIQWVWDAGSYFLHMYPCDYRKHDAGPLKIKAQYP